MGFGDAIRTCLSKYLTIQGGMPPLKWSTNWDMIIPF
jgi:hypothetical protein